MDDKLRQAWSDLDPAEPPELVDLAILNRARRDLERSRRRRLRWIGGFATATVIVVALSLTLQQGQQAPEPEWEKRDGLRLQQSAEKSTAAKIRRDKSTAAPARQAEADAPEPRQRTAADALPSAPVAAEISADASRELLLEESFADESKEEEPATEGPEAWVERLILLRDSQQDEQLARELAAFREAYPDFPLPPGLEQD